MPLPAPKPHSTLAFTTTQRPNSSSHSISRPSPTPIHSESGFTLQRVTVTSPFASPSGPDVPVTQASTTSPVPGSLPAPLEVWLWRGQSQWLLLPRVLSLHPCHQRCSQTLLFCHLLTLLLANLSAKNNYVAYDIAMVPLSGRTYTLAEDNLVLSAEAHGAKMGLGTAFLSRECCMHANLLLCFCIPLR